MKIKIFLAAIFTLFSLQFAQAQQSEIKTTHDIVRLVSDANLTLNSIYRQRVAGHEMEQASLQKAIYAANKELLLVRELLTDTSSVDRNKLYTLQNNAIALQSAVNAIDSNMSDADLARIIADVQSKAVTLKTAAKKIKKK